VEEIWSQNGTGTGTGFGGGTRVRERRIVPPRPPPPLGEGDFYQLSDDGTEWILMRWSGVNPQDTFQATVEEVNTTRPQDEPHPEMEAAGSPGGQVPPSTVAYLGERPEPVGEGTGGGTRWLYGTRFGCASCGARSQDGCWDGCPHYVALGDPESRSRFEPDAGEWTPDAEFWTDGRTPLVGDAFLSCLESFAEEVMLTGPPAVVTDPDPGPRASVRVELYRDLLSDDDGWSPVMVTDCCDFGKDESPEVLHALRGYMCVDAPQGEATHVVHRHGGVTCCGARAVFDHGGLGTAEQQAVFREKQRKEREEIEAILRDEGDPAYVCMHAGTAFAVTKKAAREEEARNLAAATPVGDDSTLSAESPERPVVPGGRQAEVTCTKTSEN
jgi:hypothetical protein